MQEEVERPVVPRSCSAAEVCGRPLTLQGCESTLAAAEGSPSISRCSSWDDSTAGSGSSSPKGSVEGTVAFGLPPHAQGALRPQLAQPFAFPSVAQGALRSTSISTSPPTRVRARSATAPYQRNSSQGRLPPFALPLRNAATADLPGPCYVRSKRARSALRALRSGPL